MCKHFFSFHAFVDTPGKTDKMELAYVDNVKIIINSNAKNVADPAKDIAAPTAKIMCLKINSIKSESNPSETHTQPSGVTETNVEEKPQEEDGK